MNRAALSTQHSDVPAFETKRKAKMIETICRYQWIAGSWSVCAEASPSRTSHHGLYGVQHDVRTMSGQHDVGARRRKNCVGIQNRTIICIQTDDKTPVEDRRCRHMPPLYVRNCSLPCQRNCILSQWSPWSRCDADEDADGGGGSDGATCRVNSPPTMMTRTRTRSIMQQASNQGQECSSLSQSQSCPHFSCFHWMVSNRSPCMISSRYAVDAGSGEGGDGGGESGGNTGKNVTCGVGDRSLEVLCVDRKGVVVQAGNCSNLPRPSQVESCVVPCDLDCIISSWSHWSECWSSNFYDSTYKQSTHRSRYKEILATSAPGGMECTSLRLVVDKDMCPAHDAPIYQWQTSNWSVCTPINQLEKKDEDGTCRNAGMQHRQVACVQVNGSKMHNRKCSSEHKPSSRRQCVVRCANVDCVVTLFSHWSKCSVTCLHGGWVGNETKFGHQKRERFILIPPSGFGVNCPHLQEQRPCSALPTCTIFKWGVGEWSQCLFPSNQVKCGTAVRRRNVFCYDWTNQEYKPVEYCSAIDKFKPDWLEKCYVPCRQECLFSHWSAWSLCSKRCNGVRWRRRTLEGYNVSANHGSTCIGGNERHSFIQSKRCNLCRHGIVKAIGQSADCILNDLVWQNHSIGKKHSSGMGEMMPSKEYCGVGSNYRAQVCNHTGLNMHPASCGNASTSLLKVDICLMSCKRDCFMSNWTTWTACQPKQRCGIGQMTRRRHLYEGGLDGGREVEKQPCQVSCDQYQWWTDDWNICSPVVQSAAMEFKLDQCGEGFQTRIVRCLKVNSDGASEQVNESMCDERMKPHQSISCNIACHHQCIVSQWSAWSSPQCLMDCGYSNNNNNVTNNNNTQQLQQHRYRAILRNSNNLPCPALHEMRSCQLHQQLVCQPHVLAWSSWGRCIMFTDVIEGVTNEYECGVGRRWRVAECRVAKSQKVVAMKFCKRQHERQHGSSRSSNFTNHFESEQSEPCRVGCAVDCVLSQWSVWSTCSQTCGLGYRSRSREILLKSDNGGSDCPLNLHERMVCSYEECFRWMPVSYAACSVHKHTCGYGHQKLKFKCLQLKTDDDEDGGDGGVGFYKEVDQQLCSLNHLPYGLKLYRECYVPCPTECLVGRWSSWSSCHVTCTKSNQPMKRYGTQARYRAVVRVGPPSANSDDVHDDSACRRVVTMETRLCIVDRTTCQRSPRFYWSVGRWEGLRRSITCVDEKGRQVQGGCSPSWKPSSDYRECSMNCESANSTCLQSGGCACLRRGHAPASHHSARNPQRHFLLVPCAGPTVSKVKDDAWRAGSQFDDSSRFLDHNLLHALANFSTQYSDEEVVLANGWTVGVASVGLFFMVILVVAIVYICRRSTSLNEVIVVMEVDNSQQLNMVYSWNNKRRSVSSYSVITRWQMSIEL
ncbi:hypothetical protein HELRODRAFT_181554 [Helobdella robusta]|uniref:Spondin-like TSP1 domain-containing protein n=1 Tax=Helobdella robusta TaxID=6412 RepID=T1FH36_HELRO|nr:hypothetical protein HELRODRAFT_181554 [Helobdella robusta]ESN92355.1 hypothetical protein HELRODRAFT_181554 [Helobdella robusta]